MKATTLVILAAGMGRRFGGLKQIEPVNAAGDSVLDYSIYDAIQAGFERFVFVVRREILEDIRGHFESRLKGKAEVRFVCQDAEALAVNHFPAREKPFGTGHAVLSVKDVVSENFCIINADDFYGRSSYEIISKWNVPVESNEFSMVGFAIKNTLSSFGPVSRGECVVSENGFLSAVIERIGVLSENGIIKCSSEGHELNAETVVSMNFWGFTPAVFEFLERDFRSFLKTEAADTGSEFFLNEVVGRAIASEEASVRVLRSKESWMGITYRQDKAEVIQRLSNLQRNGVYPVKLW